MPLKCAILAAGKGKRLNLPYSKVTLEIMGKSVIERILKKVKNIPQIDEIIVVTGFDKENVASKIAKYNVKVVEQKEQKGTADAINSLLSYLGNYNGDLLVINGDLPLIQEADLQSFVKTAKEKINIAISCVDNPAGFGRILRDTTGTISKIAEEIELTPIQKTIKEVNVGIYIFNWKTLKSLLRKLKKHADGEYYITDLIEVAYNKHIKVGECFFNSESVINLNTWEDYAKICEITRKQIIVRHLVSGVKIPFINSVYIEEDVEIGSGTLINPFTVIEKDVIIGKDCIIGPFARIRSKTKLADGVIIGNFMELKNTIMGEKSKARHLSYLGDAIIGKNVNIGAGTITANYDGKTHNTTIIEDNVTTGSGTVLIAPVKMGKGSQTGAGAIVTKGHNVRPNEIVVGIPAHPLKKKQNLEIKN